MKMVRSRHLYLTNRGGTTPISTAGGVSMYLADADCGILLNRLTTVQRDAIDDPDESLLLYNTDEHRFEVFDGADWVPLAPLMTGGDIVDQIDDELESADWRTAESGTSIVTKINTQLGGSSWQSGSTTQVNAGTTGQIGYYAANGSVISATSRISLSGNGILVTATTSGTDQAAFDVTQQWTGGSTQFGLRVTIDRIGGGGKFISIRDTSVQSWLQEKFGVDHNGAGGVLGSWSVGTYCLLAEDTSYIAGRGSYLQTGEGRMQLGPNGGMTFHPTKNFNSAFNPSTNAADIVLARAAAGILVLGGSYTTQLNDGTSGAVLQMRPITAPSAPPAGSVYLYVDTADKKLKAMVFGGTTTDLSGASV